MGPLGATPVAGFATLGPVADVFDERVVAWRPDLHLVPLLTLAPYRVAWLYDRQPAAVSSS